MKTNICLNVQNCFMAMFTVFTTLTTFFMMFKLNVDFFLGQFSFDQSSSVSYISKQMFNESVFGLFKIK